MRAHWFGQCYAWRVGPGSLGLRAWAGPGVWIGAPGWGSWGWWARWPGVGAPAAAHLVPGDRSWVGSRRGDRAPAPPLAWSAAALCAGWSVLAWRMALARAGGPALSARAHLGLEGGLPLRLSRHGAFGDETWELPRAQVAGLELDGRWVQVRVGSGGRERRLVLVARASPHLAEDGGRRSPGRGSPRAGPPPPGDAPQQSVAGELE